MVLKVLLRRLFSRRKARGFEANRQEKGIKHSLFNKIKIKIIKKKDIQEVLTKTSFIYTPSSFGDYPQLRRHPKRGFMANSSSP